MKVAQVSTIMLTVPSKCLMEKCWLILTLQCITCYTQTKVRPSPEALKSKKRKVRMGPIVQSWLYIVTVLYILFISSRRNSLAPSLPSPPSARELRSRTLYYGSMNLIYTQRALRYYYLARPCVLDMQCDKIVYLDVAQFWLTKWPMRVCVLQLKRFDANFRST